jgi:hypothetical protein
VPYSGQYGSWSLRNAQPSVEATKPYWRTLFYRLRRPCAGSDNHCEWFVPKLEGDDVGRTGNEALARAANATRTREAREALKLRDRREDAQKDVLCRAWIVFCDPGSDLIEVGPRLRVDYYLVRRSGARDLSYLQGKRTSGSDHRSYTGLRPLACRRAVPAR